MKNKSAFFRLAALWVMLFGICSGAFSQDNTRMWNNYNCINNKDLIVRNFCIEGSNIWFATNGGLVRFNTETKVFANFTRANSGIPANEITALCPYTTGKIAVGTASGVGIFDGTKWEIFNRTNAPLIKKYAISKLAFINGKLYVASIQRLFIYDQTSWKTIFYGSPIMSATDFITDIKTGIDNSVFVLKMNGVFKIVGDSIKPYFLIRKSIREIQFTNDTLWMSSMNGLYCQKDTLLKKFDTTNSTLPGNKISQIKLDSKNRIWLLTDKGLAMFNPSNSECTNYGNDSIRFGGPLFMNIDQNDHIWVVGNNLKNSWMFDGTSWKRAGFTNILPDKRAHNFIIDKKNKLWIYSPEKGFSKFDKNGTTVFDSSRINQIVPLQVLYQDLTRKIFFADEDVIFDYNNTTFEATVIKSGYTNRLAPAAYDTLGGIFWKATSASLEKCLSGVLSMVDLKSMGAPSNNIAGIYLEKTGALLISTLPADSLDAGCLLRYDGATVSTLYTCDTSQMVSGIVTDRDSNVWIGIRDAFKTGKNFGRGIAKFDGTTWTEYNMFNSRIPGNSVNDLCTDEEGNLWMGTNGGGLAKFDRKDKWTVLNVENSVLPDNNVENIAVDAENNIWVATTEGTISYIPQVVSAPTAITSPSAEMAKSMEIYPMPCSEVVNIRFNAATGMESAVFSIYNLTGQKMVETSKTISGDNVVTLPVDGLSQGIYMLKVSNKSYTISKMLMVK